MKLRHVATISSLTVITAALVLGGFRVGAQTDGAVNELSDNVAIVEHEPKIVATSPWYVLKEWWWAMVAASHFNDIAKQEIRLEHMNERLAEVQALMNGEVDERTQAAITKTLDRYQQDAGKFEGWVGGLQEDARQNAAVQTLLQKNAGWEVQRQYFLDKIASDEDVGADLQAVLQQALASSFSSFIETLNVWQQPKDLVTDVTALASQSSWLQKLAAVDFLQRTA
ncbi:MAG: hypothetical protein AAB817_01720, partial [Patescibacteria group bacterium]